MSPAFFSSVDWGVAQLEKNHPELGVTVVPRPSQTKGCDGAMLKAVFTEIIQKNSRQQPQRPIHCSLFRQVQAENVLTLKRT